MSTFLSVLQEKSLYEREGRFSLILDNNANKQGD